MGRRALQAEGTAWATVKWREEWGPGSGWGACLITLRISMRLEVRCEEWEGDDLGRWPGARVVRTWNAMQSLHSSGLGAFRELGNEKPARGDSDGPGQQWGRQAGAMMKMCRGRRIGWSQDFSHKTWSFRAMALRGVLTRTTHLTQGPPGLSCSCKGTLTFSHVKGQPHCEWLQRYSFCPWCSEGKIGHTPEVSPSPLGKEFFHEES